MSDIRTFSHDAMNTTFTARLVGGDAKHAANAASSAFNLLNSIEQSLSRYIEGSDVWQINHMRAGESIFISDTCCTCMRQALELHLLTNGLFDITLGKQIEHVKNKQDGERPGIEGALMLDPEKPVVHCLEAGREIDLGGIGKGFALDRLQQHLCDLGITDGLLGAGASTLKAYGKSKWPITLGDNADGEKIQLNEMALSASGTGIQGSHIISPRSAGEPEYLAQHLWVLHESAAAADAFSTAAILMNHNELHTIRSHVADIYTKTGGRCWS